jgi:protein-tyrosine phosphatase
MFSDKIVDMCKNNIIPTLNNSRYILIEFPMTFIPRCAKEVLFNIRLLGYIPIIAHPERNLKIMENPDIIEDLIELGCYFQINAGSITGQFKRKSKNVAWYLLRKSFVTVIASDSHSDKFRKPDMRKAFFIVMKKFGINTAKDLFFRNPLKIITNKNL